MKPMLLSNIKVKANTTERPQLPVLISRLIHLDNKGNDIKTGADIKETLICRMKGNFFPKRG